MTVSTWVKSTAAGAPSWSPVFAAKHGENAWGWQVRRNGSQSTVDWTLRGAGGDFGGWTEIAFNGGWHHVACTYDGQHKTIYVDGFTDRRATANSELRDDCHEQVIFGARNNGGSPQAFADVQLDDVAIFGQTLSPQQILALAQGVSPTNLPANTAASPLIYDFEDGTRQGWRNVLVSRAMIPGRDNIPNLYLQEYQAGSVFNPQRGSYKLEPRPQGSGNEDARHATMLVRSPRFKLDGSGDLSVWLGGGKGPDKVYANESDNINSTHSENGTMRVYLRRASDGAYLLNLRKTVSGSTLEKVVLTQAQLAPYVNEVCTLDLIDATDGGWGWIVMDDVVIPATLIPEAACNTIQFDMCQQQGTYLGTLSPGHAVNSVNADERYWNGSGADMPAGQLFWGNGAPAPEISIDFGVTTNNAGGANISWESAPIKGSTTTGSGVYSTFLMKDWVASTNNNDLAVRVSGLTQGVYRVFALVREPSALTRTYDVYFGASIESRLAAGAELHSIAATSATTWEQGGNYATAIVRVNAEEESITVIVAPTSDLWGTLQGLQIVNITDSYYSGTVIIVH
ncbi:MAG: LamG domain-containing protein [Kiritimatiellae bacterium]|nr:LamG domain-containing protein [Kiritimatiellia bacterium]